MGIEPTNTNKIIILLLLFSLFLTGNTFPDRYSKEWNDRSGEIRSASCRFGVGSPWGYAGYDIQIIGVGGYINWQYGDGSFLSEGVDYIQMFRVSDFENRYQNAVKDAAAVAGQFPGQYYLIGNEPDTVYENQDGITPEKYAERYFTLATLIKESDATARIGFGSIVQTTPIRMRYLERAWNHLGVIAGGTEQASALIDFWTVHAFILNEEPNEWGAGVPPGFEDDHDDIVRITDISDTHNVEIFKSRIRAMRIWMAGVGEQNKPLWISEMGSLLPPIDPPLGPNLSNVSDEDTIAFMIAAFDYLVTEQDYQIGLPSDNHRLVQRWFWYSLNEYRYKFGGSLFDPSSRERTLVGDAFAEYISKLDNGPDINIRSVIIHPQVQNRSQRLSASGQDYRVDFVMTNTGSAAFVEGELEVYEAAGYGRLLGSAAMPDIPGCGEEIRVISVWLNDLVVSPEKWLVARVNGDSDIDISNNTAWFYLKNEP